MGSVSLRVRAELGRERGPLGAPHSMCRPQSIRHDEIVGFVKHRRIASAERRARVSGHWTGREPMASARTMNRMARITRAS